MAPSKKPRQQTIEATLGRDRINVTVKKKAEKSASIAASASNAPSSARVTRLAAQRSRQPSGVVFTPGSHSRRAAAYESSSSDEDDIPAKKDEKTLPLEAPRAGASVQACGGSDCTGSASVPITLESGESEDSGTMVASFSSRPLPTLKAPTLKRAIISDDSDDEPIFSPPKRMSASLSPPKRRRLVSRKNVNQKAEEAQKEDDPEELSVRPPSARKAVRKLRTSRDRAFELLRRKRAGEAINREDLSSSSDEDVKPLYDTDSDHVALEEFEDDEEGVPDAEESDKENSKVSAKKPGNDDEEDLFGSDEANEKADDNLADFIVDDGPMGVPAEVLGQIPAQFTNHARRPLRDHFRIVVEWLIQFRLNPTFRAKNDDIFRISWQKLDDEVNGLAQSKFTSSAWKLDFHQALRARPRFSHEELDPNDPRRLHSCDACGRSGHPATWAVTLTGTPYWKKFDAEGFLEPVEYDLSSSEPDETVDEDENRITAETKVWLLGSVCDSNAETAHYLLHWKRELMDWVGNKLEQDGHMKPRELKRRDKLTYKQKCKIVDEVIDSWAEAGTIKSLYKSYFNALEAARSKTTTGRDRGSKKRR